MRKRADLLTRRVVETLRLAPMTARQVADALCVGDEAVRQALRALEFKNRVRRAGWAPKPPTGCTPYLWVAS